MDIQSILNNPKRILKILGVTLVGVIIVAFVISLLGSTLGVGTSNKYAGFSAPSVGIGGYGDAVYEESRSDSVAYNNGIVPSPSSGRTTGSDAEEFEVTEYKGSIETRDLKSTCKVITDLKPLEYVIFENSLESDKRCDYVFKVEHEKVDEILAVIQGLNPKELSENTYTIKRILEDITTEEELLRTKLESVDKTLSDAIASYDSISALAVRVQDVESLSKIIDSKLNLIERLTNEKININSRIDRIAKSKARELDRLTYTYFNINVFENKFVDRKELVDSWKATVRTFVRNVNGVLQDITVNLVALIFFVIQYAIYYLLILIVAKFGWKITKRIWREK